MSSVRRSYDPQNGQESFGLVGWLEETKVRLPLKGIECRFDVCGSVLDVKIDQVFYQSAQGPLDCLYSFPLPAGAAVYRCEMHVNGRVIRAKVEEERKAREIFARKKAEGRRASLVEVERENLFTLSLGNLQPRDMVVIRLAYFQTLTRLGDELSLQIPVCPCIRYIPGEPLLRSASGHGIEDDTDQVPDASRISPPRIDAGHSDAASFYLEGKIDRTLAVTDTVASPTHPVVVEEREQSISVLIAQRDAVPDRDFVLRWKEPEAATLNLHAWSYREGDDTYALVQLRAPADLPVATDFEQDVYFLLDRSGSMDGIKWTKACEALRAFLKILGDRDRAWITLFESEFRDFAEKPLSPATLRKDPALQNIEKIGVDGGTELLPALRHVLEKVTVHSKKRHATLLLITDGAVGNESEILESLKSHRGLRVHTFGIDTTVNDAFLKQLANQQRGQCFLQTPNDDIAGTVAKLTERIRRPVLTDLHLADGWEAAAGGISELCSGEVVEIPLRAKAGPTNHVEIGGRLASGENRSFGFDLTPVENCAVKLLWGREHIEHLWATKRWGKARKLAKTLNILCRGAAFIAWDEAEKVAVSNTRIYQPSLDPALWETLKSSSTMCRYAVPWPLLDYCVGGPGPVNPPRTFNSFCRSVVPPEHPETPEDHRRIGEISLRYEIRDGVPRVLFQQMYEWRSKMIPILPLSRSRREVFIRLLCCWVTYGKASRISVLLDPIAYMKARGKASQAARFKALRELELLVTAESNHPMLREKLQRIIGRMLRGEEEMRVDALFLLGRGTDNSVHAAGT